MKHKLLIFIWFLLASIVSQLCFALDFRKMYEASVPVKSQTTQERKSAIESAFKSVLTTVSGDRNIIVKETMQSVLVNPERYVKQFRYQQVAAVNLSQDGQMPPPSGDASSTGDAGQGQQQQLLLWVQFDRNAVNNALKSAGECIWGRRQDVLVWLVIDDRGQRSLVSVESEARFRDLVSETSARRGLPLLFPLYDLQDQMQLKVSDIWGNFAGPILTASRRYRAHATMVGRISLKYGNSWEGKWALYEKNNVDQWSSMGGSLQEALSGGIDGGSDILARRYKERYCNTNTDRSVILTVLDVRKLQHHVRAQKYLESLQSVESVTMESVSSDTIQFKVALRGTAEDLTRNISVDARMVPVEQSSTTGNSEQGQINALEYRYLP